MYIYAFVNIVKLILVVLFYPLTFFLSTTWDLAAKPPLGPYPVLSRHYFLAFITLPALPYFFIPFSVIVRAPCQDHVFFPVTILCCLLACSGGVVVRSRL